MSELGRRQFLTALGIAAEADGFQKRPDCTSGRKTGRRPPQPTSVITHVVNATACRPAGASLNRAPRTEAHLSY
jgi:hypothetical protein